MSDAAIRELERRWRTSGEAADEERWLQALARAGLEPPGPESRVTLKGSLPVGLASSRFFQWVDQLLVRLGEEPFGEGKISKKSWKTRGQEHDQQRRSGAGITVTLVQSADLAIPIMESRDCQTSAMIEWSDPPTSFRLPYLNTYSLPYEIEGLVGRAARTERVWLSLLNSAFDIELEYDQPYDSQEAWLEEARALPLLALPTQDPVLAERGWQLHPRGGGRGCFAVRLTRFMLGRSSSRRPSAEVIGPLPANPAGLNVFMFRPRQEGSVDLELADLFRLLTGEELPAAGWVVWSERRPDDLRARFLREDATAPAFFLKFVPRGGVRGETVRIELLLVCAQEELESTSAALRSKLEQRDEGWVMNPTQSSSRL